MPPSAVMYLKAPLPLPLNSNSGFDKSRAGAEVLSVAYSCLQESLHRDHHICCIRQQQKSPLSFSKVRAFYEFMLSGSYVIENYDMIGRHENDTLSENK